MQFFKEEPAPLAPIDMSRIITNFRDQCFAQRVAAERGGAAEKYREWIFDTQLPALEQKLRGTKTVTATALTPQEMQQIEKDFGCSFTKTCGEYTVVFRDVVALIDPWERPEFPKPCLRIPRVEFSFNESCITGMNSTDWNGSCYDLDWDEDEYGDSDGDRDVHWHCWHKCLGDFNTPINDCQQAGDYLTVLGLLKLFAQQLNTADAPNFFNLLEADWVTDTGAIFGTERDARAAMQGPTPEPTPAPAEPFHVDYISPCGRYSIGTHNNTLAALCHEDNKITYY